ncbi:MAG: hypothetical protein KGL16_01930 [Acidobacteriota bacterium]|nr:hypothetical protein [Acidobacteriota bacterium]
MAAASVVSRQLSGLLEQRRTQRMIDSHTDHLTVCGRGRVGRSSHTLAEAAMPRPARRVRS